MLAKEEDLIRRAKEVLNPRKLSSYGAEAGSAGSALITDKGNIYTGVCIDTSCGMGFCAEANAIGSMVTDGESRIEMIVAVDRHGVVISPCGRCREFMWQVHDDNGETKVILDGNRIVKLKELLPERWLRT